MLKWGHCSLSKKQQSPSEQHKEYSGICVIAGHPCLSLAQSQGSLSSVLLDCFMVKPCPILVYVVQKLFMFS